MSGTAGGARASNGKDGGTAAKKTLNLFGTLSGRGKRVAVAAASLFTDHSSSSSSSSSASSSASSSSSSPRGEASSSSSGSLGSSSSSSAQANVKVTPIKVPSVRELKQLWEKDVISNREGRSDSGSSSRKPSLVDFPDLGTSSGDEEEEPMEQQNGLRRPRRGSKIVQQKAMLFGGVKWKAANGTSSASSSTSSSPVGSLTSSPALIDARARKPPTKAKDEIVRDANGATSSPSTAALSSPSSSSKGALRSSSSELPLSLRPCAAPSTTSSTSSSPRGTKKDKKDKKASKQGPKMKKEKERSRDQPRGTSVEEDQSRASSTAGAGGGGGGPGAVGSGKDRKEDRDTIRLSDHSAPFEFDPENLHYIDQKAASGEYSPHQRQGGEERSSPTTPPGKKKRARALTDMGRPALPLLRLRTDSRETAYPIPSSASPSSPSSSSSSSSSACSLSLEPVPDEWGAYHHSPSSPSRGSDHNVKNGFSINLAALHASSTAEKSSDRKDKSKDKAAPRPLSPRSRNRELLIKMFQEEANNYSTSQLTRKHSPQEEDDMSDLESFAFWLLAENFKRSATTSTSPASHRVRRDFAFAVYAKYLQSHVSTGVTTATSQSAPVSVSPSILSDIESQFAKKDSPLHPLLFEAAQAEVWRTITKGISYSLFMKKLFHAILACDITVEPWKEYLTDKAELRGSGENEDEIIKVKRAVKDLKSCMYLLPDVVFAEFVRYATASSGVSVAPPELKGLVQGNWDRGKWEEDLEEDGVRISQMTFSNGSLPACRGIGVVPAPSYKVLDFMMSLDERSMWDDLYSVGRVEKSVQNVGQLLRIELWIPGGRNVQGRDLLVFRTAKRFSDGTCVYLYRSVLNKAISVRENCIRAGTKLSGFLIVPAPDNCSTVIAISQLDPKGYVPPTAIKSLNRMQVKLIPRLGRHIQDVARASEQLINRQLDVFSPFVVSALYSYNCEWNQDNLFSKHSKEEACDEEYCNANLSLQTDLSKETKTEENSDEMQKDKVAWIHRVEKYLSFREGDRIVVIGKGTRKNGGSGRFLVGFNERTRCQGLVDTDYVRVVPASTGESTTSLAVASAAALAVASTNESDTQTMPAITGTDQLHPSLIALAELLGLSECGLRIIEALCACIDSTTEVERTARAYMEVLRAFPNRSLPLLISLVADEIRATGIYLESTLFRGSDIASHLLSVYCHIIGKNYLADTLQPLIELVINAYAQGKSLEVDPIRLQPDQVLDRNLEILEQICAAYVATITNSITNCPVQLRMVCHHLHAEVMKKFPESKYTVLSGFFFLRFINPAIVSPERYGLVDVEQVEISPECRRGLVLVSKVIQNLANGIEFGEKEQHMVRINRFIAKNIMCVECFFDRLSKVPAQNPEPSDKVPLEEMMPQIRTLHYMLCAHVPVIGSKLANMTGTKNLGAAPFKQLLDVLIRCPSPSISNENKITATPKKHKLRKFIGKVQMKKEKVERERKEKKAKREKEKEQHKEKDSSKEYAEEDMQERTKQDREILNQEIRRVGGNVKMIDRVSTSGHFVLAVKRDPPPVPARASKPSRRTVGGVLGSQRFAELMASSEELDARVMPGDSELVELNAKKDRIQRAIEALFVAASSPVAGDPTSLRQSGSIELTTPRRAMKAELGNLLRSFESIVRRIDRLENGTSLGDTGVEIETASSSASTPPSSAPPSSTSVDLTITSPPSPSSASSSSSSPLSSLSSSADNFRTRPPRDSSSFPSVSSSELPTVTASVSVTSRDHHEMGSSPRSTSTWMRSSGSFRMDRPAWGGLASSPRHSLLSPSTSPATASPMEQS